MAKFVYIGSTSTSKRVRSIYLGVSSASRVVTKAYVGVGGVAKQFWPRTGKYSEARGSETLITTRHTTEHTLFYNCYGSYTFDSNSGMYSLNTSTRVRLYANPQTTITYGISGYTTNGGVYYQLTTCRAWSYYPGGSYGQVIYYIYGMPMTTIQNY